MAATAARKMRIPHCMASPRRWRRPADQTITSGTTSGRETRPGWKVLRVLGTLLKLPGFDADTADDVRASVLPSGGDVAGSLSNAAHSAIAKPVAAASPVERVADIPIYSADALVRRAASLIA